MKTSTLSAVAPAFSLSPFTRTDWYAYSGAEPFADGSEPLLGYLPLADDLIATVVVDANGVAVMGVTLDGCEDFFGSFSPDFASRAVAQLPLCSSAEQVRALPGYVAEASY